MAKTSQLPRFLRLGNALATTLVRAGFKVGLIHLLTVRGRKSGLPRTTPIAVVEVDGKRYLGTPYGVVDWVRNLRAAGEATLTRGRRSEVVRAIELPPEEAGPVLKGIIDQNDLFAKFFGVTRQSSLEEFERATVSHPVFLLQSAA